MLEARDRAPLRLEQMLEPGGEERVVSYEREAARQQLGGGGRRVLFSAARGEKLVDRTVFDKPLRFDAIAVLKEKAAQNVRLRHWLQNKQTALLRPRGAGEDVRNVLAAHARNDD